MHILFTKRSFSFFVDVFIALVIALFAFSYTNVPAYAAATNLVPNPSVETVDPLNSTKPQNWVTGTWGTNTSTFSYVSTGHTGTRSLKVSTTAYSSGDAKWYFTPQSVIASHTYTISDFYKATIATRVVIQFDLTNGTQQYIELSGASASATSWKQYSATVTAPATAKSMTVFHLISAVGSLTTDDYSVTDMAVVTPTPTPLVTPTPTVAPTATPTPMPSITPTPTVVPTATPTPTITPPPANLVPNNSVETQTSSSIPTSWTHDSWGANATTFTYSTTSGHTGTHSLTTQMSSYTDGDAKWYFPHVNVIPGAIYQYSDYYMSTTTTDVVAEITLSDGSTTYIGMKETPASAIWAHYSDIIYLPSNAVSMTVFHLMHSVGTLTTDDFSLTTFTPSPYTRALVSLTFDDGWVSQATNALPLMQKYNAIGTFYLVSSFLDDTIDGYMTTAQATAIQAAGNELGSHTVTHPHLPTLTASQLAIELSQSQATLNSKFAPSTMVDFASPYGEYNDAVIAAIQQYYRSHRTVDEGYNYKSTYDLYHLKVQNVLLTTTQAQVSAWLDQAIKDKSWLILVYHEVDNGGDPYGTTATNFEGNLQLITTKGIKMTTIDQAIIETSAQN